MTPGKAAAAQLDFDLARIEWSPEDWELTRVKSYFLNLEETLFFEEMLAQFNDTHYTPIT